MMFKRGKVYSRAKTSKYEAKEVLCVYSSGDVAIMRNLKGEDYFLDVVHLKHEGALKAYAMITWENE